MKLAEALILRADLQKRMEQIKSRMLNNVIIQEGEEPGENPNMLIEEYLHLQEELSALIKAINRTNNNTKFTEGKLLSEALTERDALLSKRNVLSEAAERASQKQDRYSRTEIKYVSAIDIGKLRKEADKLAKEFREIDTKIQGMNWNVDLI